MAAVPRPPLRPHLGRRREDHRHVSSRSFRRLCADCPYGDRVPAACSAHICSTDANRRMCCFTCRGVAASVTSPTTTATVTSPTTTATVTSPTTDVTATSPSRCVDRTVQGSSCADVLFRRGKAGCYSLEKVCCKSCAALKDESSPGA